MEYDTSNYRLSTPNGCVAQLCALCGYPLALDPGVYTAAQVDQRIAAHHAVCSKRPIAPGDYVRLDVSGAQFVDAWQEGTVEELDSLGYAAVRLQNAGPEMASEIGNVRRLWVKSLRRIPRPAAVPTCAPSCQCGAHVAAPPGALIDGIDREACLARWMENRLAVEGGAAPANAMTRMQIDVGRALWLERYGAQRAAELRAKVEAGREAERNRVTYSELDAED